MDLRFSRFHPLVSFLYYIGAVALVITMLHPMFLLAGLAVILLVNYLHDQMQGLKRWKWLMVTTFVLLLLFNPLFNQRGRHLLFVLGDHRVTLESVLYGGMNALSIIAILALFVSYNIIMSPNKLLFLFSKFLPQFAVLLMLTLRFIPLMRRRVEEISLIQTSKGISITEGTWGRGSKLECCIFKPC